MCTLIVAVRADPERALIVAANRDEALGRPAEGPQPRRFGDTRVFAPLDVERGGTWMGISERGLFVALTNRFGLPRRPERRSRGAVVAEALRLRRAGDAPAWMSALDPREENAFHLLVADRDEAWLSVVDGETVKTRALPSGVHVITERAFGAAPSARQDELEARFRRPSEDQLDPDRLEEVLASHAGGPFDGVCVHVPEHDYGTRSAAIVELFSDPERVPTWRHAGGPPCRARFEPTSVRFG